MEEITQLYSSMSIPSTINSYSIAIEYMKQWFLDKFNDKYFKTIHVDGKHVLDDFRNFNITKALKTQKPSVAIIPQLQFDFDRDRLDLNPFGIDRYMRMSNLESSFFKDLDKNMYIAIALDALNMNFTFRVRVSSRAQQVDLFRYMQQAFRIGSTQGEYIDMDFHIPYCLMIQAAVDAGFEVIDNKITYILDFVNYLNKNSKIPVLYKYRTINGKNEFFLRFREVYMHISALDSMNADDGEREGMLSNNFMIEMTVSLTMPAPKTYIYYSANEHQSMINAETDSTNTVGLFSIKMLDIPDKNIKGWTQYVTTEYYEEDISKPLEIDFKELFQNSELWKVIEYSESAGVSTDTFLDIKLFNNENEIATTIDWINLLVTSNSLVTSKSTYISIYVDLKYVNDALINIEELNKSRLQ
jgi:hypothetical protein